MLRTAWTLLILLLSAGSTAARAEPQLAALRSAAAPPQTQVRYAAAQTYLNERIEAGAWRSGDAKVLESLLAGLPRIERDAIAGRLARAADAELLAVEGSIPRR